MSETRARRRIRQAVESRGYGVESIEWEPVYDAGEMSGWAGGWTVVTDRPHVANTWPGNETYGLSVEEALADIDWSLRESEPCACDLTHPGTTIRRMPASPLKGDPHKPLHEPDCRWYIAYRLRWWREDSDDSEAEDEASRVESQYQVQCGLTNDQAARAEQAEGERDYWAGEYADVSSRYDAACAERDAVAITAERMTSFARKAEAKIARVQALAERDHHVPQWVARDILAALADDEVGDRA